MKKIGKHYILNDEEMDRIYEALTYGELGCSMAQSNVEIGITSGLYKSTAIDMIAMWDERMSIIKRAKRILYQLK